MSLREALSKPIIEPARHRRSPHAALISGATTLTTLLAPDGIDRRWSHMVQIGDSFMTTLEVRAFPPTLSLAWLDDPELGLDTPGTTVHQRLVPIPDALARRVLARSEDAALGTLAGDAQRVRTSTWKRNRGRSDGGAAPRSDRRTDRLFQ